MGRLVEYFFVAVHEPSQDTYKIVARFPTNDHPNLPFPEHAANFCAPYPSTATSPTAPTFHAFVLQLEDGKRLFGATIERSVWTPDSKLERQCLCLVGRQVFAHFIMEPRFNSFLEFLI